LGRVCWHDFEGLEDDLFVSSKLDTSGRGGNGHFAQAAGRPPSGLGRLHVVEIGIRPGHLVHVLYLATGAVSGLLRLGQQQKAGCTSNLPEDKEAHLVLRIVLPDQGDATILHIGL